MTNLSLDMSELEDLKSNYAFGAPLVESVAIEANKVLLQGGQVIVERRYANAPPDRLHTLSSVEEFNKFWDSFFAISEE